MDTNTVTAKRTPTGPTRRPASTRRASTRQVSRPAVATRADRSRPVARHRSPEPVADAVLLAPDGSTAYLASAVATELDRMSPGAVLRVDIEPAVDRADFVEWCLTGGRRIANPFAHYLDPAVLVVAD